MNVNIIDTPGKLYNLRYTYNIVHSSHVKGMGGTLFIELLYLPVLGAQKGIICLTKVFKPFGSEIGPEGLLILFYLNLNGVWVCFCIILF